MKNNILRNLLILGVSVSVFFPTAVMAGSTAAEKNTDSVFPSVTGITHVESYEELYDLLRKQKENSSEINARSNPISMYAEEDMAESVASSKDTGSTSADFPEDIDKGFTYDDTEEHSSTNTQEENVDEADIVKTDGKYIYTMDMNGTVHIVETASMEITGEIPGAGSADYMEMYVNGDCLQLICQKEEYITYQGKLALPSSDKDESSQKSTEIRSCYSVPITTVSVETYNIKDRSRPEKEGTYTQDGSYLSSRRYDGCLYVYTSFVPDTGDSAEQLEYYVPRTGEEYIACDNIYYPVADVTEPSWEQNTFLVTGAVQDAEPDRASDIMAVVSGGETFYVSEHNVYSAVTLWQNDKVRTEIVRIGYKDGEFTDGSTGSVPGRVNNSFSMNEYDGNLRLVTTSEGWDDGYSEYARDNGLYILDKEMTTVGKIEDLAEGEEIKSARFMGKTGYFVTYENTDPLFSADLSDPGAPKILGKLKITGFSEYLHFFGKDKLLGIGWETDPDTGNMEGLKCAMFDISDPSDVKETDRILLKDVSICDALSAYRAILAAPDRNLFGFAYGIYRNAGAGNSYHTEETDYYGIFTYSEKEGFVPETYLNIRDTGLFDDDITDSQRRAIRGVYAGDVFYLVTAVGINSYDMTDGYSLITTLKWEK